MTDKRNVPIAVPATGEEEWQAVRESLVTGWVAQGPKVAAFEKAFAERHNVAHAVACTSGTTALHLAAASLGIGPGDEVIVPSFTWIATANVVLYCGATPVFVDVDRRTFNVDPAKIAEHVTERTKAIITVHLFGLCADIDAIAAAAPGVTIIEDAACAAGASYKGRPAGSLGRIAAFSFHPRKSITTGEGGMVTTDDADMADHVRALRNHGATVPVGDPKPYVMADSNMLGFNYRMTDLQAAVGLVQLSKLDASIAERSRWAAYYTKAFADVCWLATPAVPSDCVPAWQSYVTYVDESKSPLPRNEIMDRLAAKGVATRPGTHAVHMLGLYRERFGIAPDDLPGARDCDCFSMAIPLHNRMTNEDYEYVAGAIKEIT